MKQYLCLIHLVISLTAYGQTCDTIDGKFINCIDSTGYRQGYWELTEKKILVSGYNGFGSKEGCRYFEEAEYYLRSSGNYKNGKKVGTWNFYSGEQLVSLDRKITFYENGSIKDENLGGRYTLNINNDSSAINGQFFHDLDSIRIDCKANKCILKLTYGQELMSFQFKDLDKVEYELLRLNLGVYDLEIKMKKNAQE